MSAPNQRDQGPAALTPPVADPTPAGSGTEGVQEETFEPGYVFARRYRMVTRIGRGGMGEVWRADDLVLQTHVALKLISSPLDEDRQRVLNEVRLARQITDPAVCRVFDAGEAEQRVFFSMELVDGEDLATLLQRVGCLPPEKVLDIAHQLCGGLAAAHAHGVLHRDLKPANILIDTEGLVRITDFGIAILREEGTRASVVGTPAYMAPEQRKPGSALSERTDLYALGLVLYELLAGRRPFDDQSGKVLRLSTLVPDVDPRLERTLHQALAADPRERPASAAEMAAALPQTWRARRGPRARLRAAIAVAGIVGILAAIWLLLRSGEGSALTDQDTVVLADFVNTTDEPVFDGTLKVALAVALEQSPFLKVLSDDRVRDALRLMERSPDERLTRSIAREMAQRERLKAVVAGSIGILGSHYVLALEALNAETGDVMAREQVEVPTKEQVLTSLGEATSKLREELGESLPSIQRFDVPLARATTASLEALHAYSLALDQGRVLPRLEAIPHLKRAIEIDPNFAMAQALLSGVYTNTGRSSEAPPFSRKAFELRDRVSERERFFIGWRYYMDAAQSWSDALQLSLAWTATYPREAFAFNSLGLASATFGQHEEAVKAFREAIRLDPRFVPPHGNLAGSLAALNRFAESKAALREASAIGIDFITLRRANFLLGLIDNDTETMTRELNLARASPEGVWTSNWVGRVSAFSGKFQMAHDSFRQGVRTALDGGFREFAAQWTMEDAESHAVAGRCGEAAREITEGLELGRDNFTLERAGRSLALCGDERRATAVSNELLDRFPDATLTQRIQRPVIAAAMALARKEPARALTFLEPVKPYDHAPASEFWPAYLRGQASLQLNDSRAAAIEFQSIVDHRGEAPTSPLFALAHLGLARAAVLAKDEPRARSMYETFLGLWQDADASLPSMKEAREQYARLR